MKKILVISLIFFYSNFLFAQIISPDKVPSALPVIREANVMFSYRIWRRLPFSHKLNMPIFLPKKNITSNKSLFEIILTGLLSGKLQLYSSSADDFSIPITKEEAIKRLNYIKLSRILDVNSDSNDPIYLDKIDSLVYLPQDVLYYIIKEDWIIDNKNSIADQRIIGVCPVVKFYSSDGIERGLKELFWLYYPNSRYYFNNFLIDKIDSDTSIKTIDDFFMKRAFSSFIIKASNVYDRGINKQNDGGFLIGIDAELESERIKAKMIELEQNLWSR